MFALTVKRKIPQYGFENRKICLTIEISMSKRVGRASPAALKTIQVLIYQLFIGVISIQDSGAMKNKFL
jgi:hypothetical protein